MTREQRRCVFMFFIPMRTDYWLKTQFETIWQKHFSDIKRKNEVMIKFGRPCRARLGSIRLSKDRKISKILINGLFRDEKIPHEIILSTIAHEITHYAQGHSSPLLKLSKFPHRGGVVEREMIRRGLKDLVLFQKKWLKQNWGIVVKRCNRRKLGYFLFCLIISPFVYPACR